MKCFTTVYHTVILCKKAEDGITAPKSLWMDEEAQIKRLRDPIYYS
jgi:hypothetical protein